MGLRTSGNMEGLQLTLTVHDRVLSRSAFDAGLGDSPTFPQTLTLQRISLDDVPADANGVRTVQLDLTRLGIRRQGNGVYPLEVQLRDVNETPRAGFVTHVIAVDLSAAAPTQLDVAWIWPLVAPPALALDGTPNADVVTQLVPTGRLGRQAAAIGADTDVPLTLAPSPETLDAWLALAQAQDNTDLAAASTHCSGPSPTTRCSGARSFPSTSRRSSRAGSAAPSAASSTGASKPSSASSTPTSTRARRCPATSTPCPSMRSAPRRGAGSSSTAARSSPSTAGSPPPGPRSSGALPGDASNQTTVVATDPGLESFLSGDAPPALRAAHLLGRARGDPGRAAEPRPRGGLRQPGQLGSLRRVRRRPDSPASAPTPSCGR